MAVGTFLEAMAETEKQAQDELHGITPLQVTASVNQQILEGNVTSTHSTSTSIFPDPSTGTTNIIMATGPLTSFADSKGISLNSSQVGAVEDKVPIISHSMLPPGLQHVSAAYQNISVPKESSIASGSFLFGPSDDGFSKEHSQLLCASGDVGNTIPLPVRQSNFPDATNPLTPVRSKVCASEYIDQGAPLTPTANLKLLLSAASPAIRERELMQQNTRNVCRSILTDATDVTEEYEYSRKQKSLSILCSRCVCVCVCVCARARALCMPNLILVQVNCLEYSHSVDCCIRVFIVLTLH